jgi:hypothetical protein
LRPQWICSFRRNGAANGQTQAAWGTLLNGTNGLQNFEQAGNANWRVMEDGIAPDLGNGFLVTKESYQGLPESAPEVWNRMKEGQQRHLLSAARIRKSPAPQSLL